MSLFSQRIGVKPAKSLIQTDSMDSDLRNSLWNAVHIYYFKGLENYVPASKDLYQTLMLVWIHYFKKPLDEFINDKWDLLKVFKDHFFSVQWYEVYDLVEFFANTGRNTNRNHSFIGMCNTFLERELSAFRFVDSTITRVTDHVEIAEIEGALDTPIAAVKNHIQTALTLMSHRENPDYRNSIKESISAVESLAGIICGDKNASLGDAIKLIEKQGKLTWHPAFKSSLDKLYGYTSNESGVRHGLKESDNLDFEEAKFMLVVSSGFVNYLILEADKAHIRLK